jgi:hypothetical protein
LARLEHPPAFPEDVYRIAQSVKHSRTDHAVKGLAPEPEVGRVPHFKMEPCGASGPESVGSGHPYQRPAQIDSDDSQCRGSLRKFNREIARTRTEIEEKALMKSAKDFFGDLTVVTLDGEPRGLLIKRGQRTGNPLYGESPFQTLLYYSLG